MLDAVAEVSKNPAEAKLPASAARLRRSAARRGTERRPPLRAPLFLGAGDGTSGARCAGDTCPSFNHRPTDLQLPDELDCRYFGHVIALP